MNKRVNKQTYILSILDLAVFPRSFVNKSKFLQHLTACNIPFFHKSFKTMNILFLLAIFNNFFKNFCGHSLVPILRKKPETDFCFFVFGFVIIICHHPYLLTCVSINDLPWSTRTLIITFLVPIHLLFCVFKRIISHSVKRNNIGMAQPVKNELLIFGHDLL